MRFVLAKTADQQAVLMMHRARALLVRQRTMLVNALRAHLAEFGIIGPKGLHRVEGLIATIRNGGDDRLPEIAQWVLMAVARQIEGVDAQVVALEAKILSWHKSNPTSRRLATIPGIGPIIATAIAATVPDASVFRSGREFAAWVGLVPRQNSTGGKARLGGISKRGDSYLRRLLVNGAHAALFWSKAAKTDPWLTSLRARKHRLVATVALANKTARIAWAVMRKEEKYRLVTTTAV